MFLFFCEDSLDVKYYEYYIFFYDYILQSLLSKVIIDSLLN